MGKFPSKGKLESKGRAADSYSLFSEEPWDCVREAVQAPVLEVAPEPLSLAVQGLSNLSKYQCP